MGANETSAPVPRGRVACGGIVDHLKLLESSSLTVRENLCARHDPARSAPMEMAEHEVVFPLSGMWIREVGRHELSVDPGRVHFLSKGETHRVRHPCGCGDCNLGVVIAPAALDELLRLSGGAAARAFRLRQRRLDDAEMVALAALRRALQSPAADQLAVEEGTLHLVVATLRARPEPVAPQANRASTRRAHRELVERTLVILLHRFREPLTLSQVARQAATSPFHLARVFKSHTGTTLHEHVSGLRTAAAFDLLLETKLSLAEIASRSGFCDAPHLCRRLGRLLGVSPSQLRNAECNDALRLVRRALPNLN